MKKLSLLILSILFISSCSLFVGPAVPEDGSNNGDDGLDPKPGQPTDIWVSAYLGAWNHYAPPGGNWGNLPTSEIDWDAFTHLFYFSLTANADGSLSPIEQYHTFSPSRINEIVSAAHDNDTKVLFSVGGWGNYPGFRNALMPENRDNFITNLINVMEKWGFDGIDIDMEPIKDEIDEENYKAFINELYKRLQEYSAPMGSKPLLTAATDWKPEMYAEIHDKLDQINLMTYDMSGAWHGWVSWHNAPVYDGGNVFASSGRPLPSADGQIQEFIKAGVPREKLGIGIDFYGYIWNGFVIEPLETWITPPVVTPNVPYYQIMNKYYKEKHYKWDEKAKAAYLSIENGIPVNNKFISFDDEKSIRAKINYAREEGIGGVIIWELSGGYRKDQPKGERDKLLQEVKKQLHKN